ncbi:MAG: hypothetical protein KAS11_00350 [Candidatus Aenigmarchaeota archaeon]|nr:hypothetical protein [Candidatus Aenigmarchaeota archaeon]
MKERYVRHMLVTSFIAAIVIFSSGVMMGWMFDGLRTDEVLNIIKNNELNSESYNIEQTFLENVDNVDCTIMTPRIETISKELGEVGQELQRYGSISDFKKSDFDYLKRKYFLMEIKFYNLIYKYQETCKGEYTPILYFYKVDDDTSTTQGYILDEFVRKYNDDTENENGETKHGKIVVLSIDGLYDKDPLIKTIMSTYEIDPEKLPALIIDYDTIRHGLVDREELENIFNIVLLK